MMRSRTVTTLLWPVVLLAALGCGKSGPKLYPVSGKVTFKGQPVPAGWVNFSPDVTKGNDGPTGRAHIQNGTYDTAGPNGQGTVGGPLIVRIQGFDGQKMGDYPDGKAIFAPFEMPTELPKEKTTKDLEVPESWANRPLPPPPP